MAISDLNLTKLSMDNTTPISTVAKQLSAYGDSLQKQKESEENKIRQAKLDAQNQQLFDLKIAEANRVDRDRELNQQFYESLTKPKQMKSGVIQQSDLIDSFALTDEELALEQELTKAGKALPKSITDKFQMQEEFSNWVNKIATDPAYQESDLERARRAASTIGYTPEISQKIRELEALDIQAQKSRKEKTEKLYEQKQDVLDEISKKKIELAKAWQQRNKDYTGSVGGSVGGSSGAYKNMLGDTDLVNIADKLKFSDEGRLFSAFGNDSIKSSALTNMKNEGVLRLLNSTVLNKAGKEKILSDALSNAIIKGKSGWISSDPNFSNLKTDIQKAIVDAQANKKYESKMSPLEVEYTKQIAELAQKASQLDTKIGNRSLSPEELLTKEASTEFSGWFDKLRNRREVSAPVTGSSPVTGRAAPTIDYSVTVKANREIKGIPNSILINEGGSLTKSYQDGVTKDGRVNRAVSMGYNYTSEEFGGAKSVNEIRTDLQNADIPKDKIKAMLANQEVVLTQDESDRLAKVSYDRIGTQKAARIVGDKWKDLNPLSKEIAADTAYRGDLIPGSRLLDIIRSGDVNKLFDFLQTGDVDPITSKRIQQILKTEGAGDFYGSKKEVAKDAKNIEESDDVPSITYTNKDGTKEDLFKKIASSIQDTSSATRNSIDKFDNYIKSKNGEVYSGVLQDVYDSAKTNGSDAAYNLGLLLSDVGSTTLESIKNKLKSLGFGEKESTEMAKKVYGPITKDQFYKNLEEKNLEEAEKSYIRTKFKNDPASILSPDLPQEIKDRYRIINSYYSNQ